MVKAPTGKHRCWVFTWNNPPDTLEEFDEFLKKYTYVYGFETAPTTGTKHLQGYVEFTGGTTFKQLREKFEIFWDVAKGDREENWAYCTKGGKFVTSHPGGFPKKRQGTRNDIEHVKDIVRSGGGMRDVLMSASSYQSAKFAELLLKYAEPARDWLCEVTWIHGPSGSGKTSKAAEMLPNAWWSGKDHKWFEGYDGQDEVIIDDLRAESWPFVFLLRMLDSKPFRVECKGGSRQWRPKKIAITTLYEPRATYRAAEEPMEQLLRRITHTIRLAPAQKSGVITDESDPDQVLEDLLKDF